MHLHAVMKMNCLIDWAHIWILCPLWVKTFELVIACFLPIWFSFPSKQAMGSPMDFGTSLSLQSISTSQPLSFRSRLSDLASEHERLHARCEGLEAENKSLKQALESAKRESVTLEADNRSLKQALASAKSRDPGNKVLAIRKSRERSSSYSYSYDDSSGSSRSRHKKRKGKKRKRSRDRDRGRKGKDRRKSRSRGKKLPNLGNHGSGDHEADLDEFISKNQLDDKVCDSLRALRESHQKKIMGTDGGENSFVLIDRVKNPNAVVTSRINKLLADKR